MQLPTTHEVRLEPEFSGPEELREGMAQFPTIYSLIFPQIGFLPFYENEYGCFWPLGKEADEPLVAFISVYDHTLCLAGSSLQHFHATELLASDGESHFSLIRNLRDMLRERQLEPLDVTHRSVPPDDYKSHLAVDPRSPNVLTKFADTCLATGDLDLAESCYRRALDVIPDYTAAHFGLGTLLRRKREPVESARYFVQSLQCPVSFDDRGFWACESTSKFRGYGHLKSLEYLQRTSKHVRDELVDEPLMRVIDKLTLAEGVETNDDYLIYQDLIAELADVGRHLDAIRLWTRYAELMCFETGSFRERYDFTEETFGRRIIELLDAGGLDRRAALARSMLNSLTK